MIAGFRGMKFIEIIAVLGKAHVKFTVMQVIAILISEMSLAVEGLRNCADNSLLARAHDLVL